MALFKLLKRNSYWANAKVAHLSWSNPCYITNDKQKRQIDLVYNLPLNLSSLTIINYIIIIIKHWSPRVRQYISEPVHDVFECFSKLSLASRSSVLGSRWRCGRICSTAPSIPTSLASLTPSSVPTSRK